MKNKTIVALFSLSIGLASTFAAQAAEYTLKLGVVTPTKHPHSVSAREFAKLVAEKTQGKVEIKVFDNASLGSNPELLDAVQTGIIDMSVSTPGVLASYSAVTGILELPYLFSSKKHMMDVTRGPIGAEISKTYFEDTGVEILSYFGGAQRNMITKSKKIESLADLKGMKMRTWQWDVMLNWWDSLGALGAVVAFPEVYTALQTGVVDGAENEFTTFTTARWAEVGKYVAMTEHNITVRPMIINAKKLAKLPNNFQLAIRDAAREAADFDVRLEGELDEKNMLKLKSDYAVVFTHPDKTPFIEASLKVINKFAKEKNIEGLTAKIIGTAK